MPLSPHRIFDQASALNFVGDSRHQFRNLTLTNFLGNFAVIYTP
jgi:hypothetical protein